jgi:antitoxin component of RelBE/YafQ-DinJ toxin-antitoxin module
MNTTLTVKLPKEVRDGAKKAAKELGIPLTTVVSGMLRQFSRDKEIHFSVYPTPKPKKIKEWERISDDMDRHPEKYKVSRGVEELIEVLGLEK